MPETLTCDRCGQRTHDDTSEVWEVMTLRGITLERQCFTCTPPDEDDPL